MKTQKPLIIVAIYLRGEKLDPEQVSKRLNIRPSESQKKGGFKPRSKRFIAKFGMWVLRLQSDSRPIAEMIDELLHKIGNPPARLDKIENVEDAHLDIFFGKDENGEKEDVEVALTKSQVARLNQLGLSVCLTIA